MANDKIIDFLISLKSTYPNIDISYGMGEIENAHIVEIDYPNPPQSLFDSIQIFIKSNECAFHINPKKSNIFSVYYITKQ